MRVVIVVAIYCICWAPYYIVRGFQEYRTRPTLYEIRGNVTKEITIRPGDHPAYQLIFTVSVRRAIFNM